MQQYFHISKRSLRIGAVLTQGIYGESLRNLQDSGEDYQKHIKESIFEEIRKSHFPKAPSRFDCSFLLPDYETASAYRAYMQGYNSYIYEIEIQEGEPFHVEMDLLRSTDKHFESIKANAMLYWSQKQHTKSNTLEALLAGKAVVKKLISEASSL